MPGLEIFIHNENPMECPSCGTRTEFEVISSKHEHHTCPNCQFEFLAEQPEPTVEVSGSWGDLTVDPSDGKVLSLDNEPKYDEGEIGYRRIHQFDFDEYRATYGVTTLPESFDILDLGFWERTDDGRFAYVAPATDWRIETGRLKR